MKNSRLIQLLKTFPEEEINEFEKFLQSPLSGSRNYVIQFFRELKKQYPEFPEDKIDREKIFLKIYKNKDYKDSTVRSIVSNLIADAEHYLSYRNFRSNKPLQDYSLLTELRSRELHNYFDLKSKPILKHIKENKQFDFHDNLYDYLISLKIAEHYFIKERFKDVVEIVNIMNDNLLLFFTANTSTVLHFSDILKTFFPYKTDNYLEKNFLPNLNYDGFISSIGNDKSPEARYLKLNFNIYNILTDHSSHESFDRLKEIWIGSRDFLTDSARKAVFDLLGNFCLIHNRKKGTRYVKEFFELSKILLRDKLFLTNTKVMHINTFRQITLHCYMLNEIDWCEKFVKNYSKYLAEDVRQMLVDFTMADISFRKKDFQNALFYLSNVKELKIYLKLELKEMYIKVYYELGYTEQLYYAFDSFRHYLKNAPFLPNYILSAKNFLRYSTSLVNHKMKNDSDIEILRKEISGDLTVHNKNWLLEKADELCD
ncbi:MAG: hypothetical protein KDD00_14665 [Ignavibacteriae bacterium]|nr:hypothetical protein [Ignavibacteriota bacterium]